MRTEAIWTNAANWKDPLSIPVHLPHPEVMRVLFPLLLGLSLAASAPVPPLNPAGEVDVGAPAQSVVLSADGHTLVVGTARDVQRLDPGTLRPLGVLTGSDGGGWGATFSRAGRLAAAGLTRGVTVWDDLRRPPRTLDSPGGRVFALAWHPDGQRLALGDAGGYWQVTPGGPRGQLRGDVMAAAWSLDGRTLFLSTGQEDSATYALDAGTGRVRWRQQNVPATHTRRAYYGLDEVNGLSLSPDGRILASAHQDGRVLLRDAATGRLRRALSGGEDTRWAAFTPDGAQVVAVGETGRVNAWTAAGQPAGQAQVSGELWHVLVLPDGRALTAGADGAVRAWTLTTQVR